MRSHLTFFISILQEPQNFKGISESCDSSGLFRGLKAEKHADFKKYLNRYDVIFLDMTWFLSTEEEAGDIVKYLQQEVIAELEENFLQDKAKSTSLPVVLSQISEQTGRKFIIIIDEWDQPDR